MIIRYLIHLILSCMCTILLYKWKADILEAITITLCLGILWEFFEDIHNDWRDYSSFWDRVFDKSGFNAIDILFNIIGCGIAYLLLFNGFYQKMIS